MTSRVIVAGGRHFKDYALLTRKLDNGGIASKDGGIVAG